MKPIDSIQERLSQYCESDGNIGDLGDLLYELDEEVDRMREDTKLLDHLQRINDKADYTGLCICRDSYTGRGWRLHETSHPMAVKDVRIAIKQHKESISSKHRKSEVKEN